MPNSSQINEEAFRYYAPLQKVRLYILENFTREVTLKDVAQIAGIERKYFSSFFHKKVGVGFKFWLMYVRICEAERLIKAENHSITQLAYKIGFADLRTFERAFKRLTGFTPRAFKKRCDPCPDTPHTSKHDF